MATSGQTLNDRINAARYALAGQGLARCVCKATTEEVIGPKKKHLDYLLACTHEPNVSIPQLANLLIERTNHIYWVVVFKALVTVHHLMSYGNERFIQYLASSNYSFELSTFLDKTAVRDFSMSTFIRRYSRYINEKALSYRLLAFDFCKVKRGNEGVLRLMPIDRLLKTLPILQNQLDALLEFDCSADDLNNGVINACFMLLFRDLIGLFACHNDGIINLLNRYFSLNRKMCREAFDLYKKFLIRMDKVSDFLRVAEAVGIDKDEIPDLRRTPSSLIDALEQHLQNIDSNKKILKQQSSSNKSSAELSVLGSTTSRRPNSPGALIQQTSSSSLVATSTSSSSQADDFALDSFKDEDVRKAIEEEARVLSQYGSGESSKSKAASRASASGEAASSSDNPLKFPVASIPKSIDDIFGDSDSFANINNNNNNNIHNINNNSSGNNNASSHDNNVPNFDNLSLNSNSSGTTKGKLDINSIKSAIQSATTTLEKGSAQRDTDSKLISGKKASDELFSLLDDGASGSNIKPSMVNQGLSQTSLTKMADPGSGLSNNVSPFASSYPFFMPPPPSANTHSSSNGQFSALKPGNPFPDVGSNLASGSIATAFSPTASLQSSASNVFNSGAAPTANYTNLGALDGFGDLLQPTSAANSKVVTTQGGPFGNSKSAPHVQPLTSAATTGLFKGDLDSTLANIAQNLTFEGISKKK